MQRYIVKVIGLGLNAWSLLSPRRAAEKAYQVFSTPPRPRIRIKERLFLDTARQLHRRVAGRDIVEYHWGDEQAPLILLSYGWGYNAGRWRHYVPALLEAGYRVIAYDPPGHGLAPAGQLNVLVNAEIIRQLLHDYGAAAAIISHSFGGSSAVLALQEVPLTLHPGRMVVMASFSFAPRVFDEYRKTLGLWPALYWRMVRWIERQLETPLERFDFAMMSSALSQVDSLLIHSPGDRVTSYAEALRYHSFWPGSWLYSPQDGGHHLGTSEITQAVLEFVADGTRPLQAERREKPASASHELSLHFAGV
ncbi:MAG: alpha/beta hydrolase [Saprospiraceae bacterium]